MGIFNILNTVERVVRFTQGTSIQKAVESFKSLGGDGTKKSSEEEFNALLEFSEMYSSIIGHIATVDTKEIQDQEMDVAIEIINSSCFSDKGLLNDAVIDSSKLSKKETRDKVYEKLSNPTSLKKIAQFAIEKEKEEDFYSITFSIVMANGEISENEREFLDVFSEELELTKFDVRNVENQITK